MKPQPDQEFIIWIYHDAVQMEAPIQGVERYLKEKAFLNKLVGRYYHESLLPRPIPDPRGDFYMLDNEQFEAYCAFRRAIDKAG